MIPSKTPTLPERNILLHALGTISQGVLVAGPDRVLTFCNQAFTKITGYTAAEISGRTCGFLQGPETDPAARERLRAALDAGADVSCEILNYKKDGTPFWNDLSIAVERDAAGAVTHFTAIIRDITAQKRTEMALAASEARQLYLDERIQAAIVVHRWNTEIVYANATASALLGVARDDIHGILTVDPCWAFIREDGSILPVTEYPVSRAIETRSIIKDQVIGIRHCGGAKLVWVVCNAYPVPDEEVVVSFTDITKLKQAELALQKSEERLRLVLQGSNDAPWDWDWPSDTVYYSPRWWQILGMEQNELPPSANLWSQLLHPDDWPWVMEAFDRIVRGGPDAYQMEFRLRHKLGHYVPVLSRGFVLRDETGNPLRVSGTITDITERKKTDQRIHELAFYDALTGLANRRLLMEQLRKALQITTRSRRHGALLFIDLDNFKTLNDTLGHEMGDQLLKLVAGRLKESVRDADTVARLGGDEFIVMLESLPPRLRDAATTAEYIGKKLLAALQAPYQLSGVEYCITASIGLTLFNKARGDADTILRHADLAMYQAKSSGKNMLRFFNREMQTAIDERLALENDLRRALQRDEMSLYYQPQVIDTGALIGAEVLVRWRHPERGMIPPSIFVPLAESSGMILPLGIWVLRTACAQLARWAHVPKLRDLSLSVNVSVRQIREDDFADQVLALLEETGADPGKLKIELTESLLAEDIDEIIAKMNALKAHGIRFALDDFGTGYSSLGYLQRMPLDELKIDRSFVRDVLTNANDSAIARIIISLADKLGLRVTAEGVETAGQRHFLAENGCTAYQGYLFGKPLPLDRFEAATRAEKFWPAVATTHLPKAS